MANQTNSDDLTLIESITREEGVEDILKNARKALDAENARFRLRSWDDKSVVHVKGWIIGSLGNEVTELAERVYYDPEKKERAYCMVGVTARIARYYEEKAKESKNFRLMKNLKNSLTDDEINQKKSWIDLQNDDRFKDFLAMLRNKRGYSIKWNEIPDRCSEDFDNFLKQDYNIANVKKKTFKQKRKIEIKLENDEKISFKLEDDNKKATLKIKGIENKIDVDNVEGELIICTGLNKKKNDWEVFCKNIKKYKNNEYEFFSNAFSRDSPWNNEDDKIDKEKQWNDLREHIYKESKFKDKIVEFLDQVENTVKHYKKLCDDYDKYIRSIEKLKYEIVVPVEAFGKFIGVLNFHLIEEYTDKEKDKKVELAKSYAAKLAINSLRWQDRLSDKFQSVAKTITAENDLEIIATKISDGIRSGLYSIDKTDVYPLLYIPKQPILQSNDMNNEKEFSRLWNDTYQQRKKPIGKKELKLWDEENKLGNISIRFNGFGWNVLRKWKLCNKESPEAKDLFEVCPYVDNPNSRCGSRSALFEKIKTTGCIPLVYDKKVYGLLYLHCKERHFFTDVELNALYIFSGQAAIAIYNAKLTGDPYEKLYGSKIIDLINRYSESSKSLIYDLDTKLKNWAAHVKGARGQVIADITIDTIKEISELFDLPEGFTSYIRDFKVRECALQSITDYRDHFIHPFHVFCLGYIIKKRWENNKDSSFEPLNFGDTVSSEFYKTWFITSIFHDVGYPLEKLEKLAKNFSNESFGCEIESLYDWNALLWANDKNDNLKNIQDLSDLFKKKCGRKDDIFNKWLHKRLLNDRDHGVLSALMLLNEDKIKWENELSSIAREAALAIAIHNWKPQINKGNNIIKSYPYLEAIYVKEFPLAFFLYYCDSAQEWGRNVLLDLLSNDPSKAKSNGNGYKALLYDVDDIGKKVKIQYTIENQDKKDITNLNNNLMTKNTELKTIFESTWWLYDDDCFKPEITGISLLSSEMESLKPMVRLRRNLLYNNKSNKSRY